MSYLTLKWMRSFQTAPYFILNLWVSLDDTFWKSNTMFCPGLSWATISTFKIYTYAASSSFNYYSFMSPMLITSYLKAVSYMFLMIRHFCRYTICWKDSFWRFIVVFVVLLRVGDLCRLHLSCNFVVLLLLMFVWALELLPVWQLSFWHHPHQWYH